MKVTILGHSYLAKENRKCLTELGKYVDLEVCSPNSFKGMIFNYALKENKIFGDNWVINLRKKIVIPKFSESVYVLKSKNLNFKSFKPSIIHIEVDPFHPLFMQAIIYRFLYSRSSKIVCTVKQNTYTSRGYFSDLVKDTLAKTLSKKVDSFIAINEGVKDIYNHRFNVPLNKINRCTHIGVDTDAFFKIENNINQSKFIIGYCGRIITYKGIWELINVVGQISKKNDVELRILGDGPEKEKLQNFAKDISWLKVLDKVEHNEVPLFMQSLNLFVMPSRILKEHVEHDSHAVLEAMSCGIPCIATKSGSNIEVLEDIGILVDPENENQLETAIMRIINNNELAQNLSEKGRKRVLKDYSLKSVAKQYKNIYMKA